MVEASLVTGWLPAALTILGALVLLTLIALPPARAWWIRALLLVIGTGAFVLLANLFITKVWKPWDDTLPISVLVWSWLGLSGLVMGVAHLMRNWRTGLAAFLAGLIVFIGISGTQINRFYGQYPTVGAALGITRPHLTPLSEVDSPIRTLGANPGGYLEDVWKPTRPLPPKGIIVKAHVPPAASGFKARPTYIYLPPAYQEKDPRPLLPVLVLLAGQPGSPDSWLISGQLARMMDTYAAAHQGLAPIVVMPDNIGSNFANPLCVDSPKGKVETYLSSDIPKWINENLQTASGPEHWAIGGLSNGGTCALQMATRAPRVYGRFLDISGELEPVEGSKKETIKVYFGGDEAAYNANSPIEIMKSKRFERTAGRIVVGRGDRVYYPQLKQVMEACVAAGMDMTFLDLPGGHTWQVWAPGLRDSLNWLGDRTGIARWI